MPAGPVRRGQENGVRVGVGPAISGVTGRRDERKPRLWAPAGGFPQAGLGPGEPCLGSLSWSTRGWGAHSSCSSQGRAPYQE